MVHIWIRRVSRRLVSRRRKKGRHLPAFLRHMGSGLHVQGQDAGKFVLKKYLSEKKNSMKLKETFGAGSGRNYSNSQFFNQNRQDAISRVSAVQISARGPKWEHWRSGGWNTRSHQQCRLQRDGNDSYGCPPLHLQSPVWQHACCTKGKIQAQVRRTIVDSGWYTGNHNPRIPQSLEDGHIYCILFICVVVMILSRV